MNNRAISSEQKKIFIKLILELWLQVPDLRFGQFLANATKADIFYLEDQDLLALCDKFIKHSKE
jgi:hypothetical protein